MKQEVINVRYLAHTKIRTIQGLHKYMKKGNRWVENPNFKRALHLPDAQVKKVAEYEIKDYA